MNIITNDREWGKWPDGDKKIYTIKILAKYFFYHNAVIAFK